MPQQQAPWIESAYGWSFGEGGWNTGMDQNLLKFSFLFDRNVDSIVASLPAAINGQAHYLTADNRLYFAVGTTYFSTTVPKWFIIIDRLTGATWQYNGSSLVPLESVSGLSSRLDAVELTVASLGTAAFEDLEYFATQAELDVVEAQAQGYTDVFRSELGTDASGLVTINDSTLRGYYGEKVSIEAYGAVPGGDATAAFAAALADLAGTDKVLYLPNSVYRITSTIRLDGLNVTSDGCELQKDFDGIGIEIQGGADYFDLEGVLYLRGINAGFYDPTLPGAVAPANPNAHGVWFNSARIRIRGRIICQYHQGDLYRFTCAGNMNKTNIDACWGWWGGRGAYFEGTQDDFSVCEIKLFMQFTWGSGVATSADFMGRGWKGYWYSEGCSIDGVSHGMDLAKLRSCDLELYCEQQNSALEVVLGAACTNNIIRSQRRNKDEDRSGAAGRNRWIDGARVYNPGFAGDVRSATPLVVRSDRARSTNAGEYVEMPFQAASNPLGSVRGEGGTTSPYIKLLSANNTSIIALANDDYSVTVAGVQQFKYVTTGITLGTGAFSLTGATNGKEVDAATTSMKSSRNNVAARDHHEFYNPNGKVGSIATTASATAYNTTSDERVKCNIRDAGSASEIIDALRIIEHDWIADGAHTRFGLGAHEAMKVYAEAVTVGLTPDDLLAIDYSKFVPLLIKEVQELRARVKVLEVS